MNPDIRNANRLLSSIGGAILRYSLVLFFLGFGLLKFTAGEAAAIFPPASNSPALFWLYRLLDSQHASDVIGVVEITLALLIASRRFNPLLCVVGSLGTAFALLVTLSFLVTTPHLDPALAFFIVKDVTLLGAALWSAGEALAATNPAETFSSKPAAA